MMLNRSNTPRCEVLLNGSVVNHVVWVDPIRRKAFVARYPFKAHKHGKRIMGRIVRGDFTIVPLPT